MTEQQGAQLLPGDQGQSGEAVETAMTEPQSQGTQLPPGDQGQSGEAVETATTEPQGSQLPPGDQGQSGEAVETATTEPQGTQLPPGDQGQSGEAVETATTEPQGTQLPPGDQGQSGEAVETATTEPQGAELPPGDQGQSGEAVETATTEPQGAQLPPGDPGQSGEAVETATTEPQGAQLPPGDQGQSGEAVETATTEPQGAQLPPGDQGQSGEAVETATTEPQGAQLPPGDQGQSGEAVETATTEQQGTQLPPGDPGQSGEAVETATTEPQGAQLPPGDQGQSGEAVETATTEPQGAQLPPGDQGQSGEAVEIAAPEARMELLHGNREMKFTDLNLVNLIGEGRFRLVYRGYWKEWDGEVAIKKFLNDHGNKKEVEILSELKHPNIITLYGTALEDTHLYIVMELAERGSLRDYIRSHRGKPNMELSLRWATDIAEGMSYLHGKEIAHRDLKSTAVLLTSALTAKIGSFIIARKLDHTTQATITLTPAWMAPEVINKVPYSKRCDLFSYGTVLWQLVTHKVPFEELQGAYEIITAITSGKMPDIPDGVDGYLSELIQQCWKTNPKERPPFAKILSLLKPHIQANQMPAILEPDNRKIEYNDIEFDKNTEGRRKSIGSGAFGAVYKGHWDKKAVAIKKVDNDKIVVREVTIMSELKHHPNIITLYGTASENDDLFIVMELAECSLYSHFKKHKGKPDMTLSVRWATELAEGMRYLHKNEIGHRDLKSLNVLLTTVDNVRVVKICDFGTARKMDHQTKATYTGTFAWMAPEVLMCKEYNKRCDLFSYGIVLWELLTHEVPFDDKSPFAIQTSIAEGLMEQSLPVPAGIEEYLSSLVRRCWKMDPEERLTFVEILLVFDKKGMIQEHSNSIKYADLGFRDKIGAGAVGVVYKGQWRGRDVAIKRMLYKEQIMKEVSIMSDLKHHNIIKLHGTASKDPHLYIVLELAKCSLYQHIQDHMSKPDMKHSLCWAAQIAKGMEYLHGKDIVHRDLKSQNVLLTNVAKICDFGTARLLDHITIATLTGTYQWMAPEVIKQEPYDKTCDLFSYGTVLWELVTHKVPFEELQGAFQIMTAVTSGNMPDIPDDVDGYLSELIQRCWKPDHTERPSFTEVISDLLKKDHHPVASDVEEPEEEEEEEAESKPLLSELELLPYGDSPIRIVREIKGNWQKVAMKLKVPEKVRNEIAKLPHSPEERALAMLRKWLEGDYECEEPATWGTLIAALIQSGFKALGRKLLEKSV